eukprot:scaffold3472_cov52-Phaeocystis_antarctica.AAC.3
MNPPPLRDGSPPATTRDFRRRTPSERLGSDRLRCPQTRPGCRTAGRTGLARHAPRRRSCSSPAARRPCSTSRTRPESDRYLRLLD